MKVQILSVAVIVLFTDFVMAQARGNLLARRSDRADSIRKTEEYSELLEPALTLEEALALAKKNDPRGYYQLAISVNKMDSLGGRKDDFYPAEYRDYFLKKAADAGYPNAMFAKTLVDDHLLEGGGSRGISDPAQMFEKYTGMHRCWPGEKVGSLTSSNDVAAVRKQYERVVALGVFQATNAIASLEKRVKKSLQYAQEKEEKSCREAAAIELIKGIVTLPPKKSAEEISAESAKDNGAMYIGYGDKYKETHWSTTDNSKLHLKIGIGNRGLSRRGDRILEFSQDGRLISVSPVQK